MMFLSRSVVDCGRPASVEGAVLLSVTGTTYGSVAMFECDEGFVRRSGDNSCVCGADGQWTGPTMVCEGNETQASAPHSFQFHLQHRPSRRDSTSSDMLVTFIRAVCLISERPSELRNKAAPL